MVFDNRITNGMENDAAPGTQISNEASMEAEIVKDRDGSDEINSEADMREAFSNIRYEAETSVSAAELTQLYRRAADLIELLDKPPFQERVGQQIGDIGTVAEKEFAKTAQALNRRGAEVGAKSNYAEEWGG